MNRRTMLQTGAVAAASLVMPACGSNTPPPPSADQPTPAGAKPDETGRVGAEFSSSLPPKLTLGAPAGLQLFVHGLCGFVLPKSGSDPLRIAMLKGYPDDVHHRHFPSLLIARDGVDVARSTARPSGIDSNHLIYGLDDMAVTVSVEGMEDVSVKVKKSAVGPGCATAANWDNFGWVLDMSQFFKGTRRDWSKVDAVSHAQFETKFGSLEQDFDAQDLKSGLDKVEWTVGGKDRVLKQAARIRINQAQTITLNLRPRKGGDPLTIVLDSKTQTVNAAILHLPMHLKQKQNPGVRLDDALAYYQMLDPSPLNPATDKDLPVPLWSANPDTCTSRLSIECLCCPPSEV